MNAVRPARITLALILALSAALAGYYLPWVQHSTAGFTMNGFDLAEWSSLHPAVRSSSPPLLASFLLRAPHVMIAIALALAMGGIPDPRWRAVGWAASLLIALRMVPPAEFVQSARGDPNYRQMALLMALGVVGVVVAACLWPRLGRAWSAGVVALLALGAVAGWAGLSRAGVLLDNFEIAVKIGPGPALYTAAAGAAGLVAAWQIGMRRAGNKKGD